MMYFVKGQLVILTYFLDGENADWEYGVVKDAFDYNIHIIKEHGGRYMHVINSEDTKEEYSELLNKQPSKVYIEPLTIKSFPVISGKDIFGRYTFKPKY